MADKLSFLVFKQNPHSHLIKYLMLMLGQKVGWEEVIRPRQHLTICLSQLLKAQIKT